MERPLRLASIDLGTNSTRILVADCDGARTHTLLRLMEITRLGEGVSESGMMNERAMMRTVTAVSEFLSKARNFSPVRVKAVATSALRECSNRNEFLKLLKREIGLEPVVVSGDEEARLSFIGAMSDFPEKYESESKGPTLVFDIGGGSTELIVGRRAVRTNEHHPDYTSFRRRLENIAAAPPRGFHPGEEELLKVVSVDVGCVRVTESFLKSDPPGEREIEEMELHIRRKLKPAVEVVGARDCMVALGLAGTVTTVSAIVQGLLKYETERIHHSVLTRGEVDDVFGMLSSLGIEERRMVRGLEPGRAGVIVGGVAVLRSLMELTDLSQIIVSEKDILDGIILDAYRDAVFGGESGLGIR